MTCSPDDSYVARVVRRESELKRVRRRNQRLRKEQRDVQKSRGKELQMTMKEFLK